MATKLGNQEEGNSKIKKSLDNWKYPKIPVHEVYNKNNRTYCRVFSSYAIKDYEEIITLKSTDQDVCVQLLTREFLKSFQKKKHKFIHLGLVQISIKPLIREGLGAPIIVCLRDGRQLDFKNSLLAIVESNLSKGPFYFNCFPSFSVSLTDIINTLKVLTLNIKTSGVPLALTYRIVCKAMVGLNSEALGKLTLGETTYFHSNFGTPNNTKWEEVQVPEGWMTIQEDTQEANKKMNKLTLPNGEVVWTVPSSGLGVKHIYDDQ